MPDVIDVLRSMRIGNGAIASTAVWIGWSVTEGDPSPMFIPILLLMFTTFMMVSGGNILNDLSDTEQDRKVHPDRPLAKKGSNRNYYMKISLFLWGSGLVATTISSVLSRQFEPMLVLIISLLLLVSYEIWSKNKGLPGNITVSILTGITFLFGASLEGKIPLMIIAFFGMASLMNISRELVKDIEDMEGDRGWRRTFPLIFGTERSSILILVSTLSAISISIAIVLFGPFDPIYIVMIIIADLLFVLGIRDPVNAPNRSQSLFKTGMVFSLMAFFSFCLI